MTSLIIPDPNAASSSGAAPASFAAGALSAGVTEEDPEEDAAAGALIDAYMRSVAERRSSGTPPADPVGDVPDWSGFGSEEIAMKEEVVYDNDN